MKRFHRAFTLVELLVVIGIIAVLISILLPAMNRARAAAKATSCASQMRQIGIYLRIYTNDSNGILPVPEIPAVNEFISWDDRLSYYDGRKLSDIDAKANHLGDSPSQRNNRLNALYLCPSETIIDPFVARSPRRSYQLPRVRVSMDGDLFDGAMWGGMYVMRFPSPTFPKFGWSAKLSRVRASTETILLAETRVTVSRMGSAEGGNLDYPNAGLAGQIEKVSVPTLHNKKWNYLFCDGHVASFEPKDTFAKPGGTSSNAHGAAYMWTRNPND